MRSSLRCRQALAVAMAVCGLSMKGRAFAIPPPSGGCPPNALCEFTQQLVVVPAYFPITTQTDPAKPADWRRIQDQGGKIQVVVALGDNGGFEQADPGSDCPPDGTGGELCDAKTQFTANGQAYQFVYGYVNTQFGSRDYTQQGSTLISELNSWSALYPTQIQGMFLDNGPSFGQSALSDSDFRNYYEPLYGLLQGTYGWKVMLNASQFPGWNSATSSPDDWVLTGRAADSAVVFENALTTFDNAYNAIEPGGNLIAAPAWWQSTAPDYTTAHIIFKATQFDVKHVVDVSKGRGASLIYVHDRDGSTDYGGVACFFEQEVAYAVSGIDSNNAGSTWCAASSACKDLTSDVANCGACSLPGESHACAPGCSGCAVACNSGTCMTCTSTSQSICNGVCTNVRTDVNNCGSCSSQCPAVTGGTPICVSGLCSGACPTGKHYCPDGYCAPNSAECN